MMAKWLGVGVFVAAIVVALIAAPIALGLALMGGSGGKPASEPSGDFSGECKANGIAYGLPTSSQADREAVFGKADGKSNIVKGSFFGKEVQLHKKVLPCIQAVERDLKAQGTNYSVREPIPSLRWPPDNPGFFHPYGAAVDINPSDNPMCGQFDPKNLCGSGNSLTDIPKEWVRTFEKYGFFWGGNYRTTKDYMHFEWHGEKP